MLTHYVPVRATRVTGGLLAVCGATVFFQGDHSVNPTCPTCRAWMHDDPCETVDDAFGPPDPTAPEPLAIHRQREAADRRREGVDRDE